MTTINGKEYWTLKVNEPGTLGYVLTPVNGKGSQLHLYRNKNDPTLLFAVDHQRMTVRKDWFKEEAGELQQVQVV